MSLLTDALDRVLPRDPAERRAQSWDDRPDSVHPAAVTNIPEPGGFNRTRLPGWWVRRGLRSGAQLLPGASPGGTLSRALLLRPPIPSGGPHPHDRITSHGPFLTPSRAHQRVNVGDTDLPSTALPCLQPSPAPPVSAISGARGGRCWDYEGARTRLLTSRRSRRDQTGM